MDIWNSYILLKFSNKRLSCSWSKLAYKQYLGGLILQQFVLILSLKGVLLVTSPIQQRALPSLTLAVLSK